MILMLSFILFLSVAMISCLLTTNPALLIVWLVVLSFNIGAALGLSVGVWMSYAVILLFTGGMMVLFSYMVTLTSNLKILFKSFSSVALMAWVVILMVLTQHNIQGFQNANLSNLYLHSSFMMLSVLTVYLLLVLATVVKLATSQSGPLKSFFKNEIL